MSPTTKIPRSIPRASIMCWSTDSWSSTRVATRERSPVRYCEAPVTTQPRHTHHREHDSRGRLERLLLVSALPAAGFCLQGGGDRRRLCNRARTRGVFSAERPARRIDGHLFGNVDLERGVRGDILSGLRHQELELSGLLQKSPRTFLGDF